MSVTQISAQLENKPGAMSAMSELLGKEGINIGSLSLIDHTDRSFVRLIADNPEKAVRVLKNNGYNCWDDKVIAAVTPDHPGGLNAVLRPLAAAKINVNYFYAYLHRYEDNAVIIFSVDNLEKAVETLKSNWIHILDEELYSL